MLYYKKLIILTFLFFYIILSEHYFTELLHFLKQQQSMWYTLCVYLFILMLLMQHVRQIKNCLIKIETCETIWKCFLFQGNGIACYIKCLRQLPGSLTHKRSLEWSLN